MRSVSLRVHRAPPGGAREGSRRLTDAPRQSVSVVRATTPPDWPAEQPVTVEFIIETAPLLNASTTPPEWPAEQSLTSESIIETAPLLSYTLTTPPCSAEQPVTGEPLSETAPLSIA